MSKRRFSETPLLINADHVAQTLDPRFLVERLRHGHESGQRPEVRRALIEHRNSPNSCLVWCGWLPGQVIATKVATVFPENADKGGLPNIHSLVTVFSADNGQPLALIYGEMFTRLKTAADSALGADLLASPHPETLGVIGAGAQALTHIKYMLSVRPSIRTINIFNRSSSRAVALAEMLTGEGRVAVAKSSADEVTRSADIITCLTASKEPLVSGASLKPGAHVDLVGGYAPDMREGDDELVRRARLFADTREFTIDVCGDFSNPISRKIISPSKIEGDLFDLCMPGNAFKRDPHDLTVFKNGGGGHLDSMAAAAMLDVSVERLKGVECSPHEL